MNIEAISGAATVALTSTILFLLVAKSWTILSRTVSSTPSFADSIMREAAQRFRDELDRLSSSQAIYLSAALVFLVLFVAAYVLRAQDLFIGYPSWQLWLQIAFLSLAAGFATWRLGRTILARRRLHRYAEGRAPLEHRAMLNHIRSVREGLDITPADVSVNWIPLYHDMGLIDAFLLPLLSGCPTVLIPTMDFLREPSLWLWGIHGYRGTLSWSPNFGYSLCSKRIKDKALEGLDLSSWRLAMSAAEPVLAETLESFAGRFGPYGFREETMTPSWGLAESGTIVTTHAPGELPRIETLDREALVVKGHARPVAADAVNAMACVGVGSGLPRARVEIRDENRAALPDRTLGEIWIHTDCLFTAYKEDPVQTAATLIDGWFDTGDQGYLVEGHLFFVSRSKDLIVIGGEKYAPHDVESAINRVPGVREGCAIAFGVMNEALGTEELGAVVETKEGTPEELEALSNEIRREVDRSIGLGIRHLHLVPPGGINKTSSGKLARSATRKRYPEIFGTVGKP